MVSGKNTSLEAKGIAWNVSNNNTFKFKFVQFLYVNLIFHSESEFLIMTSDQKFMLHFRKQKEKLNCPKTQVLSSQSPKTVLWNPLNMISNPVSSLELADGFSVAGNVFTLRLGSSNKIFSCCWQSEIFWRMKDSLIFDLFSVLLVELEFTHTEFLMGRGR